MIPPSSNNRLHCALQSWLNNNPEEDVSVSSLLKFFIHLRDSRKLAPLTIKNYRTYLFLPIKILANIDLKDWKFRELDNAFFIESPRVPPTLPSWSVQEVLDLLKSSEFDNKRCSKLQMLKKALFLTALATGNRVSEIAAMFLPLKRDDKDGSLQIPVRPGFLYKNQRLGRTPPNIIIMPLKKGPKSICPVATLKAYIFRTKASRGHIFRNSETNNPLRPQTVSSLLCSLIEEANPGSVPKGHDTRKQAASLAWTRGLSVKEIISRAFWKDSNVFVDCYLAPTGAQGVALNTQE